MCAFVGYIAWHAYTSPTAFVIISPAYVDEQPFVFEDGMPLDPETAMALYEGAMQSGQIEYIDPNS